MRRFFPVAWRWFLLVGAAWAVRLCAQEVTVAPLTWLDPQEAPETLPVRSRGLDVEFPTDLRQTPDIGWAMIDISLNEKGKVTAWTVYGSQPAYKRAMELGTRDDRDFKPARRGGAPVNSRVRLTVVFNPASAKAKGAEATPRLLDAAVVVDPQWTEARKESPNPQQVEWVVASVDAQGAVVAVRGEPEGLKPLLEASVRSWRFAPARQAGVAVAAEVRVPCIIVAPDAGPGKEMVRPRVVSRHPPVYPFAMRRSGLRGDVVVEFIIDKEGRVRNATVVRSLNPAFDEPALEAVRQWKFEPARVGGRAVEIRMQQPISFSLDGMTDGGGDGMEVRRKGDPAKLPAALKYDTPPKIDATVVAKYPYELLRTKVTGTAQVVLLVGTDGKVVNSKVLKADRPEFGYALQAAGELFEYLPALKAGQPTPAPIVFEQEFEPAGAKLVTDADRDALALERKHPERILKGRELDAPLKVAVSRAPIFPRSVNAAVDRGHAVVEFLVNHRGEVCLPRVVSSTDPVFGYAAVQAVSAWRFGPPTSQGKPGVARVQVPIDFVRPPEPGPNRKNSPVTPYSLPP